MVGKYRTVASLNILWKDNYILLSKSSRNNCYRSFSPFFTNHIKVHSRRYMICRKVACPGSKILPTIVAGALACENRPHRWQESPRITAWCLNKSTIQTQNLLSIHCLQLVLVRVSTWRDVPAWLEYFWSSKAYANRESQWNTFPLMLHHGCFLLIMHVNKLLITAQPIRNLGMPTSAEMNKRGSS